MKISRRMLLLSSTTGAVAVSGGLAFHGYRSRYPTHVIGNSNTVADVLGSLKETVGPGVTQGMLPDFLKLIRRDFSWIFHPMTEKQTFRRVLCSEFIINSNLPENNFDIAAYQFQESAGLCSPFLPV